MTRCPHCWHELRHVLGPEDVPPEAGDFLVCTWCRGIGEYVEGGDLARPLWRAPDLEALVDVLEARGLLPATAALS